MESGAVATRPRFTRMRRIFGASYKYLNAEDVRALDRFETETVQGGAGAFYLPNLLPNSSFEQRDAGAGLAGWTLSDFNYDDPAIATPFVPSVSAAADDGDSALCFTVSAITCQGYAFYEERATATGSFAVRIGDVLSFAARVNVVNALATPAVPGVLLAQLFARLTVVYSDDTQQVISQVIGQASTGGYSDAAASFTVPAGAAGVTAATAQFAIVAKIGYDTFYEGAEFYSGGSCTAGQAVFTVDRVGLALATAVQAHGRMPGSSPLGRAVRLSKPMQVRDAGIASGAPAYDVTLELTEL